MNFPLNSMIIGSKWRIKRELFHNYNKFYVQAVSENQYKEIQKTLILMIYDELLEQPLFKTIQKINMNCKQNTSLKLLIPENLTINMVGKSKMFVMELNQKLVTVDWMVRHKKHEFSTKQIIEAALSGITCLSQLHSLNITHGHINTKTSYFYNKKQKIKIKTIQKTQTITTFGFNVTDIDKFSSKSFNQDKIEDLIYQPFSKSLQVKPGFKEDVQSFLYVLIKMATKQEIFSIERYQKQWVNEQAVRKWKINQLYLEMIQKVPKDLRILIQIYLIVQQLDYGQKIDYSLIIKKILKQKQKLLKQDRNKQVVLPQTQNNNLINQISLQNQIEGDNSEGQIFEQDIKLNFRKQQAGFFKKKQKLI